MDFAKTLQPHWVRISKTVKRDMLLKYHLTCVNSAYTVEAFLDLVAKAFSPTPEIAQLAFSLDFSAWLRPHFQDHIQDIDKPHKFEFTRDDAAARIQRFVAHRLVVQHTAFRARADLEERANWDARDSCGPAPFWHFSPFERESWKNLLDDLDEKQTAPSAAFSGFWPQRKEEVDDFLREYGQTAPAEARHTMAINADLNNTEAARVEAEARAQVLQDGNAFRGVHAGAKERLHANTSPSDAKGTNLVVIDVSDTKRGKRPVDTSREKCLALPWKLVKAVPLSYAKAIHDASGSREVFNEDGTMRIAGQPTGSGGAAERPDLLELAQSGRVGAKSVSAEDDYLAVPELLHRAECGYEAVRPVSRVPGLFPLSTDLTNEYLKQDDRRVPAQEEYLWMSCFGAHMAALFVALDELLPYVPATNQDFTPYLARARNHAEAIDKAFRFRLAFLRRLNEIKRVHARKQPLLLEWWLQLPVAGVGEDVVVDVGVAAKDAFGSDELGQRTLDLLSSSLSAQTLKSYAGRLSQFAEFCHDSENISPLEATTATVVRYVAWIGERGHIAAKSLQPYLSAINTFFELHILDPIAKDST
eukprot:jgi/Tetstr1/445872/TSEL_033511.t1